MRQKFLTLVLQLEQLKSRKGNNIAKILKGLESGP